MRIWGGGVMVERRLLQVVVSGEVRGWSLGDEEEGRVRRVRAWMEVMVG